MKDTIYEMIVQYNHNNQKGIDFISDIKDYMRELLLKYFIKFIFKTQNDETLPSILFYPIDEKLDNKYQIYINNLNFQKEEVSMLIKGNSVSIIFGLTLPLIYPYLSELRNFASTMTNDYIKFERKIKKKKTKDPSSELKEIKLIQEYFNKTNIFEKMNDSSKIDTENVILFYENYRKIFIFSYLENDKNSEELLEFIFENKFKDKLNSSNNIGEVILWIETYKYFIIDIIKICSEVIEDINKMKKLKK